MSKSCELCGAGFITTKSSAKFCSRKCRDSTRCDCGGIRHKGARHGCKTCVPGPPGREGIQLQCQGCGETFAGYKGSEFCAPCRRTSALNLHRVTREGKDLVAHEQGHACAICGRYTPLVIDHNHRDGRIRGLLCDRCNRGIGLLRDEPAILDAAATYLRRGATAATEAVNLERDGRVVNGPLRLAVTVVDATQRGGRVPQHGGVGTQDPGGTP